MYLGYDDYTAMGGNLPESTFNRFGYRAEKLIDTFTQSRLKDIAYADIIEEVKRCMVELIDYLSENSVSGAVSGKQAESNDGYSVTYESKSAEQAIRDIIYTYLSDTGLMYRGVAL